jgi:hypothetical protein
MAKNDGRSKQKGLFDADSHGSAAKLGKIRRPTKLFFFFHYYTNLNRGGQKALTEAFFCNRLG